MFSQDSITLVTDSVKQLLSLMTFEADVNHEVRSEDDREVLMINVSFEQPNLLIGQQGINLQAFQHIARLYVRSKVEEPIHFIVDVNEYKTKRLEYLRSFANDVAHRVLETNQVEVLQAMSSYERRVVHMELSKNTLVTSESLGEEPNRRIVIRPASQGTAQDENAQPAPLEMQV